MIIQFSAHAPHLLCTCRCTQVWLYGIKDTIKDTIYLAKGQAASVAHRQHARLQTKRVGIQSQPQWRGGGVFIERVTSFPWQQIVPKLRHKSTGLKPSNILTVLKLYKSISYFNTVHLLLVNYHLGKSQNLTKTSSYFLIFFM